MKFVFKVIISLILVSLATLISVGLFTSTDVNKDSYIRVGKFPTKINAQVFEYSNARKSMYTNYNAWKYEMSKNIAKKIYGVGNFTTKLHLKHDLNTLTSAKKLDYIAVFSVKNINSEATLDLSRSTLNITGESFSNTYSIEQFTPYMKILKYDSVKNDFFTPTSFKDGASVVMIDLQSLMSKIPDTENATITLVTTKGSSSIKIKDRTVKKDTVTGDVYVYDKDQRYKYSHRGTWLKTISRDIMLKYYLREKVYNLKVDRLNKDIIARAPMTYVGFVHGLNFDKPNMFDKRDLTLEIKTNEDSVYLDFKTLRHHTLYYIYDEDSDDFVSAGMENIVDACSIDLATLIAPYSSKQYIKIKLSTSYDDIVFDLK